MIDHNQRLPNIFDVATTINFWFRCNAVDTLCIPRLDGECTTGVIYHFTSLYIATEELSVEQTKLETCREVYFHVLRSTFLCLLKLWSAYQRFITNMPIVLNIKILMHGICRICKIFCNYLWLFKSKAESRTSRVRFHRGWLWDHLPITHPPLPSVARPALSVR